MTDRLNSEAPKTNLKAGILIVMASNLGMLALGILLTPELLGLLATLQGGLLIMLTYFQNLIKDYDLPTAKWLDYFKVANLVLGGISIILYFVLYVF